MDHELKQISSALAIPDKQTLNSPLRGVAWRRQDRNALVLTYATEDRTGLVHRVAELAATHGLQFARSECKVVDDVASSTFILEGDETGLQCVEKEFVLIGEVSGDVLLRPEKQLEMHFVAEDRPGLLRDVSRVFSSRGINMRFLSGFVHRDTKQVMDLKTRERRLQEVKWAVFFIRIELLVGHLEQMADVKKDLRILGEFVAVGERLLEDRADDQFVKETVLQDQSDGTSRKRYFAGLCNSICNN